MNRLAHWVLNILAGLVFFILFIVILFPTDELFNYLIKSVEVNTGGEYRLAVSESEPSLLFQSVLHKAKLYHKVDGVEQVWLDFPEFRIRFHYLALLTNQIRVSYEGISNKGHVEGEYASSTTDWSFKGDFDHVSLGALPVVANEISLPLEGAVSGHVDFTLDPNQPTRDEGKIDLQLLNWHVSAGRITPYAGFDVDVPDTKFSNEQASGVIKAVMGDSRIDIQEISLPGDDIKVSLKGKVTLNKKSDLSRINLTGNLQFSPALEQALPFLLVLEKQKGSDGSYPISVAGRLLKPKVQIGTFEAM